MTLLVNIDCPSHTIHFISVDHPIYTYNSEVWQEQEQLKWFLDLWPSAADNKVIFL